MQVESSTMEELQLNQKKNTGRDLHPNSSSHDQSTYMGDFAFPTVVFNPLDNTERRSAADSFGRSIVGPVLHISYTGIGNDCKPYVPPKATHDVKRDGNCLYRCVSYVIWGHEDNHRLLRREVCKFLEDKTNWQYVCSNLPVRVIQAARYAKESNGQYVMVEKEITGSYTDGDEYVRERKCRSDGIWGGSAECCAIAHITTYDIIVYAEGKIWTRFGQRGRCTASGFYLCNPRNEHYQVITSVPSYSEVTEDRTATYIQSLQKDKLSGI